VIPVLEEPKCSIRKCKHFIGAKGYPESEQAVVCKAYPNGIPDEIAFGNDLHLEPRTGDHGIQFEKA